MTEPPDPLAQEPAEQLAAMVHKLRHDLRNAYAVSGAVAVACGRAAPEHREFAAELAQRFAALAQVQARLIDQPAGAALPALAAELVAAFAPRGEVRLATLPELALREQHARLVALALAELCADSLRRGALRDGAGASLCGRCEGDRLALEWREPAGGWAEQPGHQLVARLAAMHRGSFAIAAAEGELVAQLELPLAGD